MTTCHYCGEAIALLDTYNGWQAWESERHGDHCQSPEGNGYHYPSFSPVWGERKAPELPEWQMRLFQYVPGERFVSYGINGHAYERVVTWVSDNGMESRTRVENHAYECRACEAGESEPDW